MVQLICCKEVAKKNTLSILWATTWPNILSNSFDFFVSNTLHISSIIHVVVIKTSVHRILN